MPAKLEDTLQRITKAADVLAPATAPATTPTKKSFKQADFNTYVTEQVAKGAKDAPDVAAARVTALSKAMETANAAFGAKAESVELEVFQEPAAPETPVLKSMQVLKGLHTAIGEGGALKEPLAKSKEGKAFIQKAGNAQAMLERVAKLFGYDLATLEAKGDSLSWKVEGVIHALQQAAKMERAMTSLGAALGIAKADKGEGEGEKEPDEKTTTKKSNSWGVGDLSAARAAANKSKGGEEQPAEVEE